MIASKPYTDRGVVLFAYNTTFDYVKIADVCAALIRRFSIYDINSAGVFDMLQPIPVTLITDEFGALQADRNLYDNIIVHTNDKENNRVFRTTHDESSVRVPWKNLTRADAYELSPYDRTLLLDCDYLMFNNKLLNLFNSDIEFTCHREVHDVTGMNTFHNDEQLSRYSIPMLWATAIYFRKTEFSKSVFDMMKLIQENYLYYSKVYGFKSAPFRNDFALSIAHSALSGYGSDNLLPGRLITLPSTVDVVDFSLDGVLFFQYKDAERKLFTGRMSATNVHVMNKEAFTNELVEKMLSYASRS